MIHLQSNETIPWKHFSNESDTLTKSKDNNGNIGSGFVQVFIFVQLFKLKLPNFNLMNSYIGC
jgi:hypothetical protein